MKPKVTCRYCGLKFTQQGLESHLVKHDQFRGAQVFRSYSGNVVVVVTRKRAGDIYSTNEHIRLKTIGM